MPLYLAGVVPYNSRFTSCFIFMNANDLKNNGSKAGQLNDLMRDTWNAEARARIEQVCRNIRQAFAEPGPKMLLRVGDGELKLLRGRHPIAQDMVTAFQQADFLGLRDDDYMNKQEIISVLRDNHQTEIGRTCTFNARLFRFAPELIGQLTRGRRVLWITANAAELVRRLDNPMFRDFYRLHGIISNHYINAAPTDSNNPLPVGVSAEQAIADIKQQLSWAPEFDFAVVGAGAVGKVVCHYIKAVLGKSAIDVGFMTSAMLGRRDQGGLLPGNPLDPLVWDPPE